MRGLADGSLDRSGLTRRRSDPYYVRVSRLFAIYAFIGLWLLWLAAPAQAANVATAGECLIKIDAAAAAAAAVTHPSATSSQNLSNGQTTWFGNGSCDAIWDQRCGNAWPAPSGLFEGSPGFASAYCGYEATTCGPDTCVTGNLYFWAASSTCPEGYELVGDECVEPPPVPECDEEDAAPGVYFCTRAALSDAQNCVEGAVGPSQCMMETCVGAPQVSLNFQVGTNKNCLQNDDGSWSCAANLCPTGEYIEDPGPDDQLDVEEQEDQSLEEFEGVQGDCEITGGTNRETINHGDYVEVCTTTTTAYAGASCAEDGKSLEVRDCRTTFSDGSTGHSRTETERDGETITGQNSSISGRGPGVQEAGDEGEEDEEGSVKYGACNSPPVCDGEPLQCAQVELQWLTMCADSEGTRGAADELEEFADGALGGITGEEVDITDSLSFYDAVGPLSGLRSCPAPLSMTLRGQTINFSLEHYCTYASYLSFLILAFASYKGGRIVISGFAGS